MKSLLEHLNHYRFEHHTRRPFQLMIIGLALIVTFSAAAYYAANANANASAVNQVRIQSWVSALDADRLTAERQMAQRNLESAGADAVPALTVALRSDNPSMRRNAADMLGYIASPLATDGLLAALKNDPVPAVRRSAAWALGEIKATRVLGDLQNAVVTDRSELVRATAADSLARIRTTLAQSAGVNEQTVGAFAGAPSQPDLLYLTAKRDLLMSRDAGRSWKSLSNVLPSQMSALAVNPNNVQEMYAGAEGMGLYKSTDGGEHWSAINSGIELTPGARTTTTAIAIDPSNSNVIYIARGIWLGTTRVEFKPLGMYYSRDGGRTWGALSTGTINEEITRLAFRDGQLFGLAGDRVLTLVTPQ